MRSGLGSLTKISQKYREASTVVKYPEIFRNQFHSFVSARADMKGADVGPCRQSYRESIRARTKGFLASVVYSAPRLQRFHLTVRLRVMAPDQRAEHIRTSNLDCIHVEVSCNAVCLARSGRTVILQSRFVLHFTLIDR